MRGVSTEKGGAGFVGKMMPSQFQNIVDVCVLCMILGGDQLFGWLTGWVYNSDENLYNQGVVVLHPYFEYGLLKRKWTQKTTTHFSISK